MCVCVCVSKVCIYRRRKVVAAMVARQVSLRRFQMLRVGGSAVIGHTRILQQSVWPDGEFHRRRSAQSKCRPVGCRNVHMPVCQTYNHTLTFPPKQRRLLSTPLRGDKPLSHVTRGTKKQNCILAQFEVNMRGTSPDIGGMLMRHKSRQ